MEELESADFQLPQDLGSPLVFTGLADEILLSVEPLKDAIDGRVLHSLEKLAGSGWSPRHLASNARAFSSKLLAWLVSSVEVSQTEKEDPIVVLTRYYQSKRTDAPQIEKDWGQKLLIYLGSIRNLANLGTTRPYF